MSRKKKEELSEDEINIRMWRMKRLIKKLDEAQGNGTSLISLIIKPKTQVSAVSKMLGDEYGTASNIKSRVVRLSVLDAITSTQQRLKLYNQIPPNGLVIYCGTIRVADNKQKKQTFDFQPYKALNTTLYHCGNRFHTEPLRELLSSNDQFGFVIMDGSGCLLGTLSGNTRKIIHKFNVTLPKKHGRGGQSALRFARLRLEKRRNYLRKVAEAATKHYLKNDKPIVKGLILAGSADFKSELKKSDLFDQRLRKIVMKVVDVAYGGTAGFTKAIELSQECLENVKYIKEKRIVENFFTEVAKDTGKFVFGVHRTIQAMEMGILKTLIVWESLDITRYCIFQNDRDEEKEVKVVYLQPEEVSKNQRDFTSAEGKEYPFEEQNLLEWLADNYNKSDDDDDDDNDGSEKNTGFNIVQSVENFEMISDRSEQGSQFCQGFGGIGGILRYKFNFAEVENNAAGGNEDEGEDDYSSEGDSDFDDFI